MGSNAAPVALYPLTGLRKAGKHSGNVVPAWPRSSGYVSPVGRSNRSRTHQQIEPSIRNLSESLCRIALRRVELRQAFRTSTSEKRVGSRHARRRVGSRHARRRVGSRHPRRRVRYRHARRRVGSRHPRRRIRSRPEGGAGLLLHDERRRAAALRPRRLSLRESSRFGPPYTPTE
jgi:hypothetical protein